MASSANISENAVGVMSRWFAMKPVIALMGEYSAGKSTLLNLFLGQELLPTKVTATNLPSIWLTYGKTRKIEGLRHDGSLVPVDDTKFGPDVRSEYLLLRMTLPSEFLLDLDIVDTPGISDPKLAKGALSFLSPLVDSVLWCSAANQAWRQSEKAMWTSFSKDMTPQSALVLTRADKMRTSKDLGKVIKRCKTDTKGMFQTVLPIATTKAANVDHRDRNTVDGLWKDTGAAALFDFIKETVASIEKPSVDLSDKIEIEPLPAAVSDKTDPSFAFRLDEFNSYIRTAEENIEKDEISHVLQQFKDTITGDIELSNTHKAVLITCLSVDTKTDLDVPRLLNQMKKEIADFESDSWCRL